MGSNKFTYRLSETAESDIDEIIKYIAVDLENPDAAQSLLDDMIKKIEYLCEMPNIGHIVDNDLLQRNDVRRILVHSYILYYIIEESEKKINIVRVSYGRRDQALIISSIMAS